MLIIVPYHLDATGVAVVRGDTPAPLHGLPMGIKDLGEIAGAGHPRLADFQR